VAMRAIRIDTMTAMMTVATANTGASSSLARPSDRRT
jgi:hypothetical protein